MAIAVDRRICGRFRTGTPFRYEVLCYRPTTLKGHALITAVRVFLMVCCLSAVIATIIAGNSWVGLRSMDATRLPIVPATIVEDVGSVTNPSKLKALCIALAGAIKEDASDRENRDRDFTEVAKSAVMLAMSFSMVSAIVLLAAWLALGRAARETRTLQKVAEMELADSKLV
ncbi:MAG: hypothetical protein EOP50_00595 [Sphingobacteriales bacterium]|nr:MAG: hypothetical protein EOP50_00595 [Sphingobacteriales bacterium]